MSCSEDILLVTGACYAEPVSGLADMLDRLCSANSTHASVSGQNVQRLKNSFEKNELHELRLDHARLFLGPFKLLAPPFGSVYLEGKNILMGESTQEVMDIYREAGLDMAGNFNNPPDHIIAELEFLAYLHSAHRTAEDENTREVLHDLHERFVRNHLGAWIEPFCTRVKQGAETDFYRELATFSRDLVLAEV